MYQVGTDLAINLTATGLDEILQNVRTILSTYDGECPMMRGIGIDNSVIDSNILSTQAKLMDDIANKVEEYEPRVVVNRIQFERLEGKLRPLVTVSLREEERT